MIKTKCVIVQSYQMSLLHNAISLTLNNLENNHLGEYEQGWATYFGVHFETFPEQL